MATSVFRDYFRGYEILGELGRGNARVLKARHTETGKLVAIKHFSFNSDEELLRRFQQESAIMKSLQHPNVVKIIDVQLNADLPFIVMELIEGGDLRSLLKTYGSLKTEEVVLLARHMTDALELIHSNNIIHRDIKPENIMYRRTENGELLFLLTDFGIAKVREQSDRITVTGASMLTYEYASPEQFNHAKKVSTPADFYSLGVVLYECITGSVPFDYHEEELLPYIHRVLSSPVPIPFKPGGRGIPNALRQLLHGLLEKSTRERIADVALIKNLLYQASIENEQEVLPVSTSSSVNKTIPFTQLSAKTIKYQTENKVPKSNGSKILKTSLILFAGMVVFWILKAGQTILGFEIDNGRKQNSDITLPASQKKDVLADVNKSLASLTQGENNGHENDASNLYNTRSANHLPFGASSQQPDDSGIQMNNDIYYNDFADSDDTIWKSEEAESEFRLENGKYIIKGTADTFTYHSSVKINLDTKKDFSITATATRIEGETSYGYGLNFCGDTDQDSYHVFYISSNGYFSIRSWEKDHWNVMVDWTKSNFIRPGREMNTLGIEKHDNNIIFLINDQPEKIIPFHGAFGNYFGFRVDGNQTVAFDQLLVKGSL
ncbi:serine/threonine-protein kinase [Pollutibacter soli]|uniref:serine/threonine-protein kinase n=1 Tax=Pollutibacter soli TaxID=3034157 RepID=UPI0030138AA1